MNGWLLEMLFFANLCKLGVVLYIDGKKTKKWEMSKVNVVNIKSGAFPTFPPNKGIWLKPYHWNQGGYDAIFIDKSQSLVRFVQLTCGDTHSFKIEFFASFLESLRDSKQSFEIKTLEIVFVIELKKLNDFKISTITGQGLLTAFKGWKKGKEKDKVEILGMMGVQTQRTKSH